MARLWMRTTVGSTTTLTSFCHRAHGSSVVVYDGRFCRSVLMRDDNSFITESIERTATGLLGTAYCSTSPSASAEREYLEGVRLEVVSLCE